MMRRASSRIAISSAFAAALLGQRAPALADPPAPPTAGLPAPPGASAAPVAPNPPGSPSTAPKGAPPSASDGATPSPDALIIPYDAKKLPVLSPPPEDAMRHRVDASQLPSLPPPFTVGARSGKQPALPPPPAGALIYWPVCGDKPCAPGTAGVWVYYPAPWPYTAGTTSSPADASPSVASEYPRRSTSALGLGIAMMAASAPLIVIGQLIHTDHDDGTVHATTAVLGALLGAGGIGLTIYGAPRVKPAALQDPQQQPPSQDQWVSSTQWSVTLGAGSVGATWRF